MRNTDIRKGYKFKLNDLNVPYKARNKIAS